MIQVPGGNEGGMQAQRVLGESLRLLFRNFGTLFVLALAPALLIEAVFVAVAPDSSDAAPPEFGGGFLVATIVSAVAGQLVVALITLASVDALSGRERRLDAYFSIALGHLVPIVLVGIMLSVLAGLAAMVFVLPGIYVYAMFFVWLPCILYEGRGIGALARAQELTRGHRWPLIGAIASLILIFVGMIILLGPIWAAMSESGAAVIASALSGVLSAFSYAIVGTFGALVYLRLRFLEDGTSPEQVADAI